MSLRFPGRLTLALIADLIFSLLVSAAAWAHGGRFQGPGNDMEIGAEVPRFGFWRIVGERDTFFA